MVVPNNHGFSYKKWSFGVFWGLPPFKETPISILTAQFFQVLRTHFLKLTFSGKSSRLKVTFERLIEQTTEVWRDFTVDSYLNEKWFGCQASHEEEHMGVS